MNTNDDIFFRRRYSNSINTIDFRTNMVHVFCPLCRKRIFDVALPAKGIIAMKCNRCENVVRIPLSELKDA